jgi:ubiquinone/menaquinone biosynthesis C-methylase UbiE
MTLQDRPRALQSQSNALNQKLPPVAVVKLVLSLTNSLAKVRQKVTPPPLTLLEMVGTYTYISNAIMVAARLGIADLLKDGPKRSEELAQAVEAHPQSLYRLLRALTNVGVFAQNKDGSFKLTSISKYLQTDTPGSMRSLMVMCSEEWHYKSWGHFLTCVKIGKTPFEVLYGMNLFQYFEQNPEAGEIFNSAMTGGSARSTAAVAATYDFSRVTKMVDVGGGVGTLVATLLKKYPQMHGVLFDRPHVIADARSFLETEGVAQRCELLSGDFFEAVPSGGDAYILQNIIHAWDDERAAVILKSCRRAIAANGKLLLSEMVIPPGNRPYFGTVFDLEMLVVRGSGRERTASEFHALFQAAGFKLTRVIPTPSYSYVIEGVPV